MSSLEKIPILLEWGFKALQVFKKCKYTVYMYYMHFLAQFKYTEEHLFSTWAISRHLTHLLRVLVWQCGPIYFIFIPHSSCSLHSKCISVFSYDLPSVCVSVLSTPPPGKQYTGSEEHAQVCDAGHSPGSHLLYGAGLPPLALPSTLQRHAEVKPANTGSREQLQ